MIYIDFNVAFFTPLHPPLEGRSNARSAFAEGSRAKLDQSETVQEIIRATILPVGVGISPPMPNEISPMDFNRSRRVIDTAPLLTKLRAMMWRRQASSSAVKSELRAK